MDKHSNTQHTLQYGTMPRSMPGLTFDSDDINYLRYRNIELETELRLVKEQLAQAQNGTQYLVNCVASVDARNQHTPANQHGMQFRSMPELSDHLRPRLGLTHIDGHYTYSTPAPGNNHAITRGSHSALDHSASVSNGSDIPRTAAPPQDDLLTFDAHENSPTSTEFQSRTQIPDIKHFSGSSFIQRSSDRLATSQTPDKTLNINAKMSRESGLGISNLGLHSLEKHNSPLNLHLSRDNLTAHRQDSTRHPAPTPKSRFSGLWTSIRTPPPPEPDLIFERAFLDGEHNRLMNSACFIEDMTGEEREQHWSMLGREQDRHSAREWKMYYERVILPAHCAKSKTTASSKEDARALERARSNVPAKVCETMPQVNAAAPDAEAQSPPFAERGEGVAPNLVQETSSMRKPENIASRPNLKAERVEDHGRRPLEPLEEITAACATSQGRSAVVGATMDVNAETPDIGTPASSFDHRTMKVFTPRTGSSFATNSPSTGPTSTPVFSRPPQFPSFPKEVSQVVFHPKVKDSSHFRTILITKMVPEITLAQVVSRIRGGKIVKATFFETKDMRTTPLISTNAAMIEFLTAEDAVTVIENGVNPIVSTGEIVQLEAERLRTPTRPLHPKLEFDMRERGLSRVFYVVCESEAMTAEKVMEEILRRNPDQKRPLMAGELENGVLFFEFADVRDAGMAWETVDFDRGCLRGMKKGFLPDPCAVDEGEVDCASGSDADDEGQGVSTAANTPAASFDE